MSDDPQDVIAGGWPKTIWCCPLCAQTSGKERRCAGHSGFFPKMEPVQVAPVPAAGFVVVPSAPTKDDVERVWDAMNLDAETEAEELQDIRVALDAFLAPYRSSED
jgi:hypothetical protein